MKQEMTKGENTIGWQLEPPARKYSVATILWALLSIVLIAHSILSVMKHWHWAVLFGGGSTSVVCFLLAKKKEKQDRLKYGADRTSWMNNVGPGWGR